MELLNKLQKYSKAIALIIAGHHYFKRAKDSYLSFSRKFVQYDDINNHETWALFFIGMYLGNKDRELSSIKLLGKLQKYSKEIAIVIVGHHYLKHAKDSDLSFSEKFVQYEDINNHETWALFFIGIYLGTKK
jgi:hypothetical protein